MVKPDRHWGFNIYIKSHRVSLSVHSIKAPLQTGQLSLFLPIPPQSSTHAGTPPPVISLSWGNLTLTSIQLNSTPLHHPLLPLRIQRYRPPPNILRNLSSPIPNMTLRNQLRNPQPPRQIIFRHRRVHMLSVGRTRFSESYPVILNVGCD